MWGGGGEGRDRKLEKDSVGEWRVLIVMRCPFPPSPLQKTAVDLIVSTVHEGNSEEVKEAKQYVLAVW